MKQIYKKNEKAETWLQNAVAMNCQEAYEKILSINEEFQICDDFLQRLTLVHYKTAIDAISKVKWGEMWFDDCREEFTKNEIVSSWEIVPSTEENRFDVKFHGECVRKGFDSEADAQRWIDNNWLSIAV